MPTVRRRRIRRTPTRRPGADRGAPQQPADGPAATADPAPLEEHHSNRQMGRPLPATRRHSRSTTATGRWAGRDHRPGATQKAPQQPADGSAATGDPAPLEEHHSNRQAGRPLRQEGSVRWGARGVSPRLGVEGGLLPLGDTDRAAGEDHGPAHWGTRTEPQARTMALRTGKHGPSRRRAPFGKGQERQLRQRPKTVRCWTSVVKPSSSSSRETRPWTSSGRTSVISPQPRHTRWTWSASLARW